MLEPIPGFQDIIRDRLGAIMLNPLRVPGITCAVCTAPIAPRFSYCYQCNADRREFADSIAKRIVPLTYAIVGTQSDSDMYRYKEPMPASSRSHNLSFQRVLLLALGFASAHSRCLDRVSSRGVSHVAVVPSLSGRVAPSHCGVQFAPVTSLSQSLRRFEAGTWRCLRTPGSRAGMPSRPRPRSAPREPQKFLSSW